MTTLVLLALALMMVPAPRSGQSRLRRLYPVPASPTTAPAQSSGWRLPVVSGLAVGLLGATSIGGWLGAVLAAPIAGAVALACRRLTGAARVVDPDPMQLAAAWDLMATCLRTGLPVPLAVQAVATRLPGAPGAQLRAVSERLALGAGPREAWSVPDGSPWRTLADAARRSAHSGAGLAEVAARAAADARVAAWDAATAGGQRAAVLITGPLGLCFLPAFLTLGVAPVVIGLASGLVHSW